MWVCRVRRVMVYRMVRVRVKAEERQCQVDELISSVCLTY